MVRQKQIGRIITGIRPTAQALQIGNYFGAIKDIVELQNKGYRPYIFVADIHALTTHSPKVIEESRRNLVYDFLASGIDPKLCTFYYQSSIWTEISKLELFLSKLISVSELVRVPALKDKVKNPYHASGLLLRYPVIMAADILIQKANAVPVGEDQVAHLEVAQRLARKINKEYGVDLFPIPQPYRVDSLKIASLDGVGKMSKSNPNGAIFLTDSADTVRNKVAKAKTETLNRNKPPVKLGPEVKNLLNLLEIFYDYLDDKSAIESFKKDYFAGVLKFAIVKEKISTTLINFLSSYKQKRRDWENRRSEVENYLDKGAEVAKSSATETIDEIAKFTGYSF